MNEQVQTKGRAPARRAEVRNVISFTCAAAVALATVVMSAGPLVAAPPEAALKKKGIEVRPAPTPDERVKNAKPIHEVPVDPVAPPNKPMKPEDVKGPHPVIKVDEETHDFGAGWVGPPLKHSFKITNGGDAPLEITRVKPACGCTIAGDYPKTLAAGATGEFPFSMASNKLRGHFEKAITISSNDPVTPELRVKLKGEMKRYVDVTPALRISQRSPRRRPRSGSSTLPTTPTTNSSSLSINRRTASSRPKSLKRRPANNLISRFQPSRPSCRAIFAPPSR
jgi:hypothetical protein